MVAILKHCCDNVRRVLPFSHLRLGSGLGSQEFERFVCDDFAIQFQSHLPVSQFVVDGFPDGVTEIKIPVVCFDVDRSVKGWPPFALVIKNSGMIDAIIHLLILATSNVDNESEFDIHHGRNLGCHLGNFWQCTCCGFPLRVDAKRSHAYFGFTFCHEFSLVFGLPRIHRVTQDGG